MAESTRGRVRKRRVDAERSRSSVLEAAIDVLARQAEASMEEIAAAAGVTRQTVYAHFPSRTALLGAVVDYLTAETATALDGLELDDLPPDQALSLWLNASWGIIERYPILLSPVIAHAAPAAGDDLVRHQPVTARLTELLARGGREGIFQALSSREWMIAAIIALGHAAGQLVTAGRMSSGDAGVAFHDSVLRLVLAHAPATLDT